MSVDSKRSVPQSLHRPTVGGRGPCSDIEKGSYHADDRWRVPGRTAVLCGLTSDLALTVIALVVRCYGCGLGYVPGSDDALDLISGRWWQSQSAVAGCGKGRADC